MNVDEVLRSAAHDLEASVRSEVDAPAALDEVRRRSSVPEPIRHRWVLVAAVLVVLAGLVSAVVLATADDDAEDVAVGPSSTTEPTSTADGPTAGEVESIEPGLTMTASPDRDLHEGDAVQVTVVGLPDEPESLMELVMCAGDALDRTPAIDGCEPSRGGEPIPVTDGRMESGFDVERILSLGAIGETVDCAEAGARCAIGVTINRPIDESSPEATDPGAGGPELVGLVGVSFAPAEPADAPTLTVTPSEGLVHGQVVTLEGEGFLGSIGEAQLCAARSGSSDPYCVTISVGARPGDQVQPDAEGRFTTEIQVWRMLAGMTSSGDAGDAVDCVVEDCTLRLVGEDGTPAPPVPLSFSDAVPAPEIPSLEVSPTTGLHPGDPVTVTVRGIVPGDEVYLAACTLGGDVMEADQCGQSTSLDPVVGEEDGEVTITVEAIDPMQYGQTCTEPGVCAISLSYPLGEGDPLLWQVRPVPVQFAP